MIAIVPLVVTILAAVVYLLVAAPKPVELARISFWCGMAVTLLVFARHTFKLLVE